MPSRYAVGSTGNISATGKAERQQTFLPEAKSRCNQGWYAQKVKRDFLVVTQQSASTALSYCRQAVQAILKLQVTIMITSEYFKYPILT